MSEASTVSVGSRVLIHFPDGREQQIEIIENAQAVAPEEGRISKDSPLGRALLGLGGGEQATYVVAGRSFTVLVLQVEGS